MLKKDFLIYSLIASLAATAGAASFWFQNRNISVAKPTAKYRVNMQPMGSLIPNLNLADTSQQKSSLYDYKTDYVLVNFWATWCPPCRREMPILKKLDSENSNLSVLGFSYDKDEAIIAFQKKIGVDYPLFQNTSQTVQLNALFGNKSGGLPYTALLDKEHKIIMLHQGEITEKQILSYIN